MTVLPEKLAQHVDDARLAENAANYPEMQVDLTYSQELAKRVIQSMLLNIPLTHETDAPINAFQLNGLMPSRQVKERNPKASTNSYGLDESLGLDEYAFMHWGGVECYEYWGTQTLGINTKNILFSPHTIASPLDIANDASDDIDMPYDEHSAESRALLEGYFDALVTGEMWLEIIARRMLEKAIKGQISDAVRIEKPKDFGEIKYFGIVAPENIVGDYSDDTGKLAIAKSVYESGFVLPVTAAAIVDREETLYDPSELWLDKFLPGRMGISSSTPRKLWSTIVEIANS